jgi:glycosyltransferase involved in cell wall biosynthesis
LDQSGVDVRVLIIDDASGDGSADVAREIAAADSRVEVIEHEVNAGHIATYNQGLLDWAKTDYVALVSADDLLTPDSLTRAVGLLDANPNAGFAYGHVIRFSDESALPPPRSELRGWRIYNGQDWLKRRFHEGTGCITSPEVVVRTTLQQRVGGYRADLPHTADIEMWMRLAAHADVGYLKGVDQAYYRIHNANMSAGYYDGAGALPDLIQRRRAYQAVLEECGAQISDRDKLEGRVRHRLAADALYRAVRAVDARRSASVPIDELVQFAEATYPEAHRLAQYRSLQLRRKIGDTWSARLRLSTPAAVARRARTWMWWQSWKRRGI